MEKAYKFASDFNEQVYLRYCLWKNGKDPCFLSENGFLRLYAGDETTPWAIKTRERSLLLYFTYKYQGL